MCDRLCHWAGLLWVGTLIGVFLWPLTAIAEPLHISAPTPILAALSGRLLSLSGDRPSFLGVKSGQLAPCPDSPNCVSSQSLDSAHQITPLQFDTDPEIAFSTLKTVLAELPRNEVVTSDPDYLYAEFTSTWLGFVDDVEFYLDREAGVIHLRSASRLGESDLGVNRQRIEMIRSAWSEKLAQAAHSVEARKNTNSSTNEVAQTPRLGTNLGQSTAERRSQS